jgi:hypothetical protein
VIVERKEMKRVLLLTMKERFDRFPCFTLSPRLSKRLDRKPVSGFYQHPHFSLPLIITALLESSIHHKHRMID